MDDVFNIPFKWSVKIVKLGAASGIALGMSQEKSIKEHNYADWIWGSSGHGN